MHVNELCIHKLEDLSIFAFDNKKQVEEKERYTL